MKSVLVIAAHPDDELLGVGGTVRRLSNEGISVRALILAEGITSRSKNRSDTDKSVLEELKTDARKAADVIGYKSIDFCGLPDNRMDGLELLDIIKIIDEYVAKYDPDTIFTHHHGDLNIDHRITCEAVLTACRTVGEYNVKRIYTFETPSSTEWSYVYMEPFTPNVFFDVSETIETKIEAMLCYRTESADYPHPRSSDGLLSLAKQRGTVVGNLAAEAFMLVRECL